MVVMVVVAAAAAAALVAVLMLNPNILTIYYLLTPAWRQPTQDLVTIYYSPLTTHYSLLTSHHSLLTTHYSLFTCAAASRHSSRRATRPCASSRPPPPSRWHRASPDAPTLPSSAPVATRIGSGLH